MQIGTEGETFIAGAAAVVIRVVVVVVAVVVVIVVVVVVGVGIVVGLVAGLSSIESNQRLGRPAIFFPVLGRCN